MSKRPGDPGYAAGWCIHYCSPQHSKVCEAGIPFDRWRETKYDQRPCFLTDKGESKPGALSCENFRRPTAEEIAAHRQWLGERMNRMAVAMAAVLPFRKTHRGRSAEIDCPVCKTGRLGFAIAASNGHCHARCTTAGCVAWME